MTRLSDISNLATPQMAMNKEVLAHLEATCTIPTLTRYLSIMFLNILTLLACAQSVDNLFQSFTVLWDSVGELLLSNIQSTLLLHQRQVVPSILLLHALNQYFHNHLILKNIQFSPPLIFLFLVLLVLMMAVMLIVYPCCYTII